MQVESRVSEAATKQDNTFNLAGPADVASEGSSMKIQSKEQQPSATGRRYTQRQAVDTWLAQTKNCIVVGGPGSGKSTLLRYIMIEILSDSPTDTRIAPWAKLLPVWIPFAFWTKQISEGKDAFDNLIWPTFDTFIWPTLRPLFSSSSGGFSFRGPGGSGVLRSAFQDRV